MLIFDKNLEIGKQNFLLAKILTNVTIKRTIS